MNDQTQPDTTTPTTTTPAPVDVHGPWTTEARPLDSNRIRDARGVAIAHVYGRSPEKLASRTALMAAAPDLLEALRAIVASLSEHDEEGLIEHAEQMLAARTAIVRAEGRR